MARAPQGLSDVGLPAGQLVAVGMQEFSRSFTGARLIQHVSKGNFSNEYNCMQSWDLLERRLPGFFNMLSTNVDRKGKEFVSTVEAKKYHLRRTSRMLSKVSK